MPLFQSKQLRLLAILAALVCFFIFNAWFLQFNFQNVSEQESWVNHTADVLSELDLTISAAKDVETGVRGYLLTGREDYLEPYQRGISEAFGHLLQVQKLTPDNVTQQNSLRVVEEVLRKRFNQLDSLINIFRAKGKISGDAITFAEGKLTMDALRAEIDKMRNSEEALLALRSEKAERSRAFFFWSLVLTTGLSVAVICLAFFQIMKNQARLNQHANQSAREAHEKSLVADLTQRLSVVPSLEEAAKTILDFLAKNVGAYAGKVFALNSGRLTPIASNAADDSHLSNYQMSLVESAFNSDELMKINKVPREFWRINSGLGSLSPTALTLMPFSFQGKRLGVLELGSFEPLTIHQERLLKVLNESIGVGISSVQSRVHLQALLEETQQQSEELQAQQEELRVNNEELEQQTRALESQQQALNTKNKELEDTQTELQIKAHHLERSSQYKSEFLAKMSHELRTPLNGLLILSTLLMENKEKNLTEQQRQFAKTINNAGNDLLTLINDILDLSKIEARKLVLRPEAFSLGELVESQRHTFEPQATSKGLKFFAEIDDSDRKIDLFTDRQRLEQILRNFLSNAVKFTEKGQVRLKVSHDSIQKTVAFKVVDTGIGIPEDKQQAIFESFEQADSSVSRKYGGTGLGLTIARELSVLLQGRITVVSQYGEGSEFSLEIPLKLSDSAVSGVAIEKALPQIAPIQKNAVLLNELKGEHSPAADWVRTDVSKALSDLKSGKKSILIVEDDEHFRSSILDVIRGYGFEAIEAANGEVALGILNEITPDAVLLDIKLPGISGLGILEMIKQNPRLRHVPVHMISALEYQQNALRLGAFGYLTKPVTIEKVRSAIDRIEKLISSKLRRVLLIEDDERQSEAVKQLISGNDLQVVPVKTGKEAVNELKKGGIDCVILDLTLPDVSGVDLLSELRSLEISLPPIVVYTGKDLSIQEENYLKKYSESIIIKGARSPERLLDEVNLFLHRVESLLPEEKREMLSSLRSKIPSFEGKTVLLVDDDIRNIFALMSALEARGLQVQVARNGVEALEALDKNKDIDLILMDIMMPKMDGYEAMRRIRRHDDARIRELPIVALTAKAMKEDHEKCMEAGANDYLPKPVNLENLTTVMKIWMPSKGFLS